MLLSVRWIYMREHVHLGAMFYLPSLFRTYVRPSRMRKRKEETAKHGDLDLWSLSWFLKVYFLPQLRILSSWCSSRSLFEDTVLVKRVTVAEGLLWLVWCRCWCTPFGLLPFNMVLLPCIAHHAREPPKNPANYHAGFMSLYYTSIFLPSLLFVI